jgi:hypothetical protein
MHSDLIPAVIADEIDTFQTGGVGSLRQFFDATTVGLLRDIAAAILPSAEGQRRLRPDPDRGSRRLYARAVPTQADLSARRRRPGRHDVDRAGPGPRHRRQP